MEIGSPQSSVQTHHSLVYVLLKVLFPLIPLQKCPEDQQSPLILFPLKHVSEPERNSPQALLNQCWKF